MALWERFLAADPDTFDEPDVELASAVDDAHSRSEREVFLCRLRL